jgi:hypothetical protein
MLLLGTMKLKIVLFLIFYMSYVAQAGAQKYFNQTDFGVLFGRVEAFEGKFDPRLNFTFTTFHGVRILPAHVVGFSVGIDTYPGLTMMPLALGWRGFREKGKKYTWFAGMDLGGGSTLLQRTERNEWSESWFDGGIMVSPSIGLRKDTKQRKHSFVWSMGYRRQEATFYEGFYDFSGNQPFFNSNIPAGFSSVRTEKYAFNSFFIKWGLMF